MQKSDPVTVRWNLNTLTCSGFITFLNANEFIEQFAQIDFPEDQVIQIDLHDLSVGDGLALLVLGKSIASVGRHFKYIIVSNPPGGLEAYLKDRQHLTNIEFTDNRMGLNAGIVEMI